MNSQLEFSLFRKSDYKKMKRRLQWLTQKIGDCNTDTQPNLTARFAISVATTELALL
jgi:hypothetical protein